MTDWNGEERRVNSRGHDMLTRIDANLSNFMARFEDHAKDDTNRFKDLSDRTGKLERFMYFASGAFVIIEFIIKYVNK